MKTMSFLLIFLLIGASIMADQKVKLFITNFTNDSELKKAGALINDQILEFNNQSVDSIAHLGQLKAQSSSRSNQILLLRNKEEINVTIPSGNLGAYLKEILPDHIFQPNAVIIDGIEKLDWGIGMENTFLGCVERLEKRFGKSIDYTDLLGLSAYGFRFHFFPEFCPSSPDATVGFDNGGYLLDLLGYQYEAYFLESEDTSPADLVRYNFIGWQEIKNQIIMSIDRGWPVIATDLIEVPEWGLITGYQNDGNELICRTYYDKTMGYEIAQKKPWLIYVIKGKSDPKLSDSYQKSLSIAATINNKTQYDEYFSGIEAFTQWSADLKKESLFDSLSQSIFNEKSHANWWIYSTLLEARFILIKYLQNNKDKFDLEPDKMDELIRLYQDLYEYLDTNYQFFNQPHFGIDNNTWDNETRQKQADIIEEIKSKEIRILKNLNSF